MSDKFVIDETNPLRLKRAKDEDSDNEEQDGETQLLEQDIEGNQRRKFQRSTKVDVTQYNDDSSDEDYENSGEAKSQTDTKKHDDSDSDMFASDDEQKDQKEEDKPKTKQPKVEFMDINEFEKEAEVDQGNGAGSDNANDEEDDDDEETKPVDDYYYDQEEAHLTKGVPKHEPKLDAFNLSAEQSEGRFDVDGNFIRGESSDDEQDNQWLDGLKKKDIRRAKDAQLKREQLAKEKRKERDNRATEELLFDLIGLLEPVETPLEALQRLNKGNKKSRYQKKKLSEEEQKTQDLKKEQVLKITTLSERLIEDGISDLYELEKESLMLKYKEESGQAYVKPVQNDTKNQEQEQQSTESASDDKVWEFRWEGDDKIHGPYGAHEMNYWRGNYFQDRVEVRKIGTDTFTQITEIDKL